MWWQACIAENVSLLPGPCMQVFWFLNSDIHVLYMFFSLSPGDLCDEVIDPCLGAFDPCQHDSKCVHVGRSYRWGRLLKGLEVIQWKWWEQQGHKVQNWYFITQSWSSFLNTTCTSYSSQFWSSWPIILHVLVVFLPLSKSLNSAEPLVNHSFS